MEPDENPDLPELDDGEGNESTRQAPEGDDAADQETGDEQETDADEGEGGPDGVEAEPRRRPSRSEARIQTLRGEVSREREARERIERQLNEIQAQQRQPQQRQESPEEESARMALMTPEERSEYKVEKALRTSRAETQRLMFQMQEVSDKSAFDAKAQVDPLYARMAPEVEKMLTELRGQGQNVSRQVLFELAVGRASLAARGKTAKLKGKGKEAVQRQRGTPLNGKADQQAQRRRSGDSPAKRLDGVQI